MYSTQLDEWKLEFVSALTHKTTKVPKKDDRDKKIKKLESEVRRKDKALAETAALLVLQKKVTEIWGKEPEEEE